MVAGWCPPIKAGDSNIARSLVPGAINIAILSNPRCIGVCWDGNLAGKQGQSESLPLLGSDVSAWIL